MISKDYIRIVSLCFKIKIIIKNEIVLVLRFLVARTAPPLLQGTTGAATGAARVVPSLLRGAFHALSGAFPRALLVARFA